VVLPTATNLGTATQAATEIQPGTTATATLRLLPSATSRIYYPTVVPCGPYYGWLKSYTVQQGDTLFHIATLYRTTVNALLIANCRQSTLIVPGERLWVPNVPTITPGITFVPTFASPTPFPTLPLTLTPIPYFTETAVPTPTNTPETPNP
jgi:hypothetical protein